MKYIYVLLLITLCIYRVTAQSTHLDPDWANQGYLISGSPDDAGSKLLLQPDGRIIAFAFQRNQTFTLPSSPNPLQSYAYQVVTLMRYESYGTLDATFGHAGKLQFYTGISNGYSFSPIPALQPDGKILISTSLLNADSSALDFAIFRITADGRIDSTFGTNGLVRNNIDSTDNVNVAVFALPNGKTLQAGMLGCAWCPSNDQKILVLQRYNSNGNKDSTYGINGVIDSIRIPFARHIILRPSGNLMVQNFTAPNLFPILPDGSFDTTWIASYNAVPPGGVTPECIETADGIYVGYEGTYGADSYAGITKLRPDGRADSSFNHVGYNRVALLKSNIVKALAQQQDHKVLLLTQSAYYDTSTNNPPASFYNACNAITRFREDGSIDSSFGLNGTFLLDSALVNHQLAADMIVQQDGKIIVIGNGTTPSESGILIFRLLNSLDVGIMDFSMGESQLEVYPNPIETSATLKYEIIRDEAISIALYSMDGRMVQNILTLSARKKGSHSEVIHLDKTLSPGAYILKLSNANGNGRSVEIIVR